MKQNMELRANSAVTGIIRDYNTVISEELKNLFNYIDGNREGIEIKNLYRCTPGDTEKNVQEMYQILVKKICERLKQPEVGLKYFQIARLIAALDDLAFNEKEVNAKLRRSEEHTSELQSR